MTTYDANALQVECDFLRLHLLSSSGDKFSVKGGSNGIKGRLKSSLNFWVETLDASDFVFDMIRRDYRLPLAEYSSQCFLKYNRFALQHPDFVAEAIIELLSNGCIVEHDVPSSAHFWPFLHDSSSQFKSFVKGVFELPCREDLLLEGPGQRQIYKARPSVFSGCPRFKMLALRVDFR